MKRGTLIFGAFVLLAVLALGFDVAPGRMPDDPTVMRDSYHLAVICERWGAWLRSGSVAIWMPEFAGGHPVHALWMYGLANPASLLWAILPIETAYVWGAILHAAFGAAGIYAYLRTRNARIEGALVAGALFVLSEYVLVKIGTGGVNQLWALAWVPWVLRAIERAVTGERGAAPALGLWAGAALLAGHVQVWLFVGPFLLLHAVVASGSTAHAKAATKRIAIGGLFAIAISAVQWIPALELIDAAGTRPDVDPDLLLQWSAPTHVLAAKLLPGVLGARGGATAYWGGEAFDHEQAGMTGAWTLLLCLLALRRRDARRMVWACAALFGFVAALGFHNEFTGWLNALPLIGWSRTPGRMQMLTVMGGAILAGHGVSDWIDGRVSGRRLAICVAVTVGALLVSALVLLKYADGAAAALPSARERVVWFAVVTAVGVTAVPMAVALARRRVSDMRIATRGVLALLVAVFVVTAPDVNFTDTDFLRVDWRSRIPASARGHRVHLADFRLPYVERQGLRTFRRPAHVEPQHTRAFQGRMSPAMAAWMDVGATLVHPGVERGAPHGLARIVRVVAPPAAPRGPARLYTGVVVEPSDERALDRLARGDDVLLVPDLLPRGAPGTSPAGPAPGRVVAVEPSSPLEVAFDVESPAAAALFVSEKWYPGWQARIDGEDVPIRRANVAFRAVRVPAGAHRVSMVYRPLSVIAGAVIAAVASLVALLSMRLASRRPPEAP